MSLRQELTFGHLNLIDVFEKMHDEIKGSIIIISHQERILNIADEIIVIANGELADRGSREKILPMLLNDTESASAGCSVLRGEGK